MIISNPYIKAKKLDALNLTGVTLRIGDATNDRRVSLSGEYLARELYTLAYGKCGEEWINSEGKRPVLTEEYKSTEDNSARFTPIGHTFAQAAKLNSFIIVGGFADGVTVWNAIECPCDICVLAVQGEPNIPKLVAQLKQMKPDCNVVVATDNDPVSKTGQRIAMESQCDWVVPQSAKDWNDLYIEQGLSVVAHEISFVREPMPDFDMWSMQAFESTSYKKRRDYIDALIECSPDEPHKIASLAMAVFTRCQSWMFTKFDGEHGFAQWIFRLNPYLSVMTRESMRDRINLVGREIAKGAREQISMTRESMAKHNVKRFKSVSEAVNTARDYEGVTIVKAPHGSGKTSILGIPFFKDALTAGDYITVLAHLRTLVADLTTKFKTHHYESVKEEARAMGIELTERVEQYQSIATCLPSIVLAIEKLLDRSQVLIVDEVSQVVRMIASELRGMKNSAVYEKIKQLFAQAERVLVLDADMDTITLNFLQECRPNERFNILIVPNPKKRDSGLSVDWCYGDGYQDHIANMIQSSLELGMRSIVAMDGKGKAGKLHAMLKGAYPDKKFLLVSAATTKNPTSSVARFMADPNTEAAKYDCVIHSPSIRSGVSITDVKFDVGFGLFTGGSIIPQDAIQMLRRARMIKHWYIGVAETASALIEDEWLFNEQQDELGIDSLFHGVYAGAHDIDKLKNAIEAKENRAKNNFSAYMYLMLKEYGFDVKMLDITEIETKESLSDYIEKYNAEFKDEVIKSQKPTDSEFEVLMNRDNRSMLEDAKIACYVICQSCGIDRVTEDWWSFYADGGVTKAKRMMWAKYLKALIEDDSVAASLHAFNKVRGTEVQKIMDVIGYEYQHDFCLTEAKAEELIDYLWQRKDRLIFLKLMSAKNADKRYGVNMDRIKVSPKPKKPIKFAKDILERFGLMTNSKRKRANGEQRPVLIINEDKMSMINHVVEHKFQLQ